MTHHHPAAAASSPLANMNPDDPPRIPRGDAARYVYMARAIAVRTCFDRWQRDDVQGEALLALVEAARRFDPERGHKLISYAWPRMNGRALDTMRRERRLQRTRASVRQARPQPESRSGPLTARAALHAALARADHAFRSDHRMVLREHYWEDRTLVDIARERGWSQAKARRVHHLALNCLRREMGVEDVPKRAKTTEDHP